MTFTTKLGLYLKGLSAVVFLLVVVLLTSSSASARFNNVVRNIPSTYSQLHPYSPKVPLDTPANTPDPCTAAWSVVPSPNIDILDTGAAGISSNDIWTLSGSQINTGMDMECVPSPDGR